MSLMDTSGLSYNLNKAIWAAVHFKTLWLMLATSLVPLRQLQSNNISWVFGTQTWSFPLSTNIQTLEKWLLSHNRTV